MLHGEHSAILLTCIKLLFVIKIFVMSFLSGCVTQVLLYIYERRLRLYGHLRMACDMEAQDDKEDIENTR